jgi:polyisoprenoid-binding protein YceI
MKKYKQKLSSFTFFPLALAWATVGAFASTSCGTSPREKDTEIIIVRGEQGTANDQNGTKSTEKTGGNNVGSGDSVSKEPLVPTAPIETPKPGEKTIAFKLVNKSGNETGITFAIPYGIDPLFLAKHNGTSNSASGQVVAKEDLKDLSLVEASFLVPIASLSTADKTRDCHMVEALGFKYAGSVFPKEHACDKDNKLPSSGPNSVSFPNIEFNLTGFKISSTNKALEVSKPVVMSASADWTIHGVKRQENISMTVVRLDSKKINVKSIFDFSIKNYEIIVKKAGPVGVADKVSISLDLNFEQQ